MDGETSRPFDIDAGAYERLRLDSAKYYYTQRSGIEIRDDLRPGYARPAGHVDAAPNQGDGRVPCRPGVCDYTLDVTGGWYDAGDHGKYVVNGGISTWEVLSTYERARHARTGQADKLGDGTLNIPESGNGVPDILDEARWELEFLLKMQVPEGEPLAGMAHHKIHDEQWTGLPLLPGDDPQKRELHPPSTAATLNLAATAAQAARLYRPYDGKFAAEALAAARTAWTAALAHPGEYASPDDGVGGGAYPDDEVSDEFYWAAAELYLTTGERRFEEYVLKSPVHTADIFGPLGFDWSRTAAAGRLDLATVPNGLPGRDKVRSSVVKGADRYLATLTAHPYGMPYAPAGNVYDWGSSHQVLNNAVVLATAYDLTGAAKYRDGALQSMDYILGRNALNISYVTGYGEVSAQNQHSRWYARQSDPALPNPPAGTLPADPTRASRPLRPVDAPGLRRPVLLHRRHPVLVHQRAHRQLERGPDPHGLLRGRPEVADRSAAPVPEVSSRGTGRHLRHTLFGTAAHPLLELVVFTIEYPSGTAMACRPLNVEFSDRAESPRSPRPTAAAPTRPAPPARRAAGGSYRPSPGAGRGRTAHGSAAGPPAQRRLRPVPRHPGRAPGRRRRPAHGLLLGAEPAVDLRGGRTAAQRGRPGPVPGRAQGRRGRRPRHLRRRRREPRRRRPLRPHRAGRVAAPLGRTAGAHPGRPRCERRHRHQGAGPDRGPALGDRAGGLGREGPVDQPHPHPGGTASGAGRAGCVNGAPGR
ncbi:hypothetical protein SHIRM173S_04870 [Streptomyces hirsutus]